MQAETRKPSDTACFFAPLPAPPSPGLPQRRRGNTRDVDNGLIESIRNFLRYNPAASATFGSAAAADILENLDPDIARGAAESMVEYFQRNHDSVHQQLERADGNFHPLIPTDPETKETTIPVFEHEPPAATPVWQHPDGDSIYGVTADPSELLSVLTTEESIFEFHSKVLPTSANNSSRLAACGTENDIRTRIRGKMPQQVNFERMPNIQLCTIRSGLSGVSFVLHLYYFGLEFIPKSIYFTKEMQAVINICKNLARTKCCQLASSEGSFQPQDDEELLQKQQRLWRQFASISAAEGSQKEGPPGAKKQNINDMTRLRGEVGGMYCLNIFEVLENLALGDVEGFTIEDEEIWSSEFHGMGRSVSFSPQVLRDKARDLHANLLVTFQVAGVKESFEGRADPRKINPGPEGSFTQVTKDSEEVEQLLDAVDNKKVLNLDAVKNLKNTLMFIDVGRNYYTETMGPGGQSLFLKTADSDELLLHAMREERVDSDSGREIILDDDGRAQELTGELSVQDYDEALEAGWDGEVDEAELDVEMLSAAEKARTTKYSMLATRGFGNVTTGKIKIVIVRQSGVITNVVNPRSKFMLAGMQMYVPFTRDYLQKKVRDWASEFNKLPVALMNLLSDDIMQVDDFVGCRELCKETLDEMQSMMYHYITQLSSFGCTHVRIEGYYDLVLLAKKGVEAPELNPLDAMVVVSNEHLLEYIAAMCGLVFPPLRKLINTECSRLSTEHADFSTVSPEARTALVVKAEQAVLLSNPPFFTARALETAMAQSAGNQMSSCEVPIDKRTDLTTGEMARFGLGYGVLPSLLELKGAGVPAGAHEANTTTATPLSRVLAACIGKKMTLPLQCVEHIAKIRKTIINHSKMFSSESDDAETPSENADSVAFFESIDHSKFATGGTTEQRDALYTDLARTVISIYEKEWHYILMKAKPRRSNQAPIMWPQRRNRLADLPSTVGGVLKFRSSEIGCTHIQMPPPGAVIRTESELKLKFA